MRLGVTTLASLGNSLGGFLATHFAMELPDRVDKLVLIGPGSTFHRMPAFYARVFAPKAPCTCSCRGCQGVRGRCGRVRVQRDVRRLSRETRPGAGCSASRCSMAARPIRCSRAFTRGDCTNMARRRPGRTAAGSTATCRIAAGIAPYRIDVDRGLAPCEPRRPALPSWKLVERRSRDSRRAPRPQDEQRWSTLPASMRRREAPAGIEINAPNTPGRIRVACFRRPSRRSDSRWSGFERRTHREEIDRRCRAAGQPSPYLTPTVSSPAAPLRLRAHIR